MGDMQFDGTQEEWDALVNKNKSKSMTAVEWLIKELNLEGYDYTIEQAKQMEKEQLNIARIDGINLANKGYGSKGSDEIKKAEEMGLYDKIELANPNDSIFTSSQTEISDEEIAIGRFMNWFLKHYSTATIDGFFGYVNAMGQEVRIQDILKDYRKLNGIENN